MIVPDLKAARGEDISAVLNIFFPNGFQQELDDFSNHYSQPNGQYITWSIQPRDYRYCINYIN